jgi:modification methylase
MTLNGHCGGVLSVLDSRGYLGLLERGLLEPGSLLYGPGRRWTAKVRADGTLITADFKGSIHQVGAHVQGAPACNGWQFWNLDVEGKLVPIDLLRQQIRAEMGQADAP